MFIEVGSKAPLFNLLNQNEEKISLKEYVGKKIVVLYFYPKAMTPGCTVQACGIRDTQKKFTKKNVVIFGVSKDLPTSLKKFEEKEKLNFDLLSDPDNELCEKYGVWQKKKNYGKEYMGIVRSTFIIDLKGKIAHVIPKVNTKTHHEDVLRWIDEADGLN